MGKASIKVRGIISLLLLVVFLIVSITGVGLHFAPTGRTARLTSWTFLGFSRDALGQFHTLMGYIMIGLVIVHFFLNYGIFKCEIGALLSSRKRKKGVCEEK